MIHSYDSQFSIKSFFKEIGTSKYIAACWAIAPIIGGFILLGSISLIEETSQSYENIFWLFYTIGFGLLAGIGLLPTYASAAVAGWIFGPYLGIVVAMTGICIATIVGWKVADTYDARKISTYIDKNPRGEALRSALTKKNLLKNSFVVALLRLSPNSPFALMNLVLSGLRLQLLPGTLGTLLGMAPRTFLVVILSSAASSSGATDLIDFLKQDKGPWWMIFGIGTLFFVGIFLTILSKKELKRQGLLAEKSIQ